MHEEELNITNHHGNSKSKPQWDIAPHLLEWLSSKRKEVKCCWGCGEKRTFTYCWLVHKLVEHYEKQYGWECKLVQPLRRTVWRFLKKLETELPYDPAIPLLGIHSEETRSERDTCTPVFIAALFTIARTWKQPRCPSADEWIRKLWYMVYTPWNISH